MKIIKLIPKEKSKFHFGHLNLEVDDPIFHTDSLFSAICNNYVRKYGDEKISEFIESLPKITSLFYGIKRDTDIFFIPKPIKFKLPKRLQEEDRKLPKKIKFISLKSYESYFNDDWQERIDLIYNERKDCLYLKDEYDKEDLKLFSNEEDEKVSINRLTSVSEEGMLYNISSVFPEKQTFFYFVADGSISDEFQDSLELIKDFGIGGKVSTGYGQIEKIESIELSNFDKLFQIKGNCKALISIMFPKKEELDSILAYKLIERKGYIYNSSTRRKPLLGFAEGSIFKKNIEGAVVDVSQDSIPAKKFGKAFLIPFKIDENEANSIEELVVIEQQNMENE